MKLFSQKKAYRFCLVTISTILMILGLQTIQINHHQAFALPPSQVESAAVSASWRNASFPVENFQGYTSGFGYRSSATGGGGTEFHSGLDIAAPLGSYVRNWWAGEVVGLSDNTACGTMITMQSGSWTHLYCHLSGSVESNGNQVYLMDTQGGITLMKGQQIPGGARIGRVGMTGRTTGPHLHWGLKYNGEYIDPAVVLRAMYQQQTS
jgi:murein DD-endopeptidase MepM/ murein hydrolase activator NlpD